MSKFVENRFVILDFDDTCFNSKEFKNYLNTYFSELLDEVWQNTSISDLPKIIFQLIPNGLNEDETRYYLKHGSKDDLIKQAYDLIKYHNSNYTLENHFKNILDLLEFPSSKTDSLKKVFNNDLENEFIYHKCADLIFPDSQKFMDKCLQKGYRLIVLTQGDFIYQNNKIKYSNLPDHQLIISQDKDKINELIKTLAKENISLEANGQSIYVDDKDKYVSDFHHKFPYDFVVIMNRYGVKYQEGIVKDGDPFMDYIQVVNDFDELSLLTDGMFEQMETGRKLYKILYPERKMF